MPVELRLQIVFWKSAFRRRNVYSFRFCCSAFSSMLAIVYLLHCIRRVLLDIRWFGGIEHHAQNNALSTRLLFSVGSLRALEI